MIKYEVSKIRRIKEYKILFSILSEYHTKQFKYENDEREGTISFTIPKANAPEINKELKESGLVFRVLE